MAFNLPPRPGTYSAGIPVTHSLDETFSPSFIPGLTPVRNFYNRFQAWREQRGLPNPGSVENLQKEVKITQLTSTMFDGARADLSKVLSVNPTFQVSHAFSLGSQTQEPSYNFSSIFVSERSFLQGTLDNEGNVSGRFNQQWSPSHVTKAQMQLGSTADRSVIQFEHEHAGLDYTLNGKTVNPSPIDGSGVYIGSYLQSLTKNLALGLETIYQVAPEGSEIASTYLVKYTGGPSTSVLDGSPSIPASPFSQPPSGPPAGTWIATAQFQTLGLLQASYYHKLSSQVEVAADLQLIAAPMKRDAVATIGAKWDLRMASFRAQLDSGGKVSALLEQRFAPSFSFLLTGEIDHFKNAAKVGVGIMLEMSSSPEEMDVSVSAPKAQPDSYETYMSSGFQQSQPHQLYPISNRRTPSTKRHINSLPSELLRHIFWYYCSIDYGPRPLILVCRLWSAIAVDCSALWGNISYIPDKSYDRRRVGKPVSEMQFRRNRIFCDKWGDFRSAVYCALSAPLNLHLGLLKRCNNPIEDVIYLAKCRELSLSPPVGGPVVDFLGNLPALEHLHFHQIGKAEVDQLFKDIERGSPLLWSLTLRGTWSLACLMRLSKLLRRIRCLDIYFNMVEQSDQFIVGLQNLTELKVLSRSGVKIPRLAFPKLLSLTIWNSQLGVDENMEFPVLDCLTLHEDWSSLPLIVAPKLTKLILQCEKTPNTPLEIVLRATVRPTSLVLIVFSPSLTIELPELLTMWSSLLELHLVYYKEVNVTNQVQLATLGGNSDHGRLCPHLRYLTVHVNQGRRDPTVTGEIIQMLHGIVEGRKRHDTDELRRVMCVWENWSVSNTEDVDKSKEIEWVDVL